MRKTKTKKKKKFIIPKKVVDTSIKKRRQGRPESCLNVPDDIYAFWEKNYDSGDFTKINLDKKVSRVTIRRAWNERKASQVNIDKITAFYNERVKKQQIMEETIRLSQMDEAVEGKEVAAS